MKYLWMLLALLLLGGLLVSAQTGSEATPELTETAPEATPEATELVVDLLGLSLDTPMGITLPQGWELALRDTYLYYDMVEDADGLTETVPIDVYRGPLADGSTGWIVVVWGYDSLGVAAGTEQDFVNRAAWLDGLRMLRLVVFSPDCNLGTAPQRDYTVGGLPATGTTFSAVDCPNGEPDTRGWFASLNVDGLNFAFYAFADPLQPLYSTFEYEIQAILDTVDFKVDEVTVSQAEFEATRTSFILTQTAPTQVPTTTP